jgi:hypothetical protein
MAILTESSVVEESLLWNFGNVASENVDSYVDFSVDSFKNGFLDKLAKFMTGGDRVSLTILSRPEKVLREG